MVDQILNIQISWEWALGILGMLIFIAWNTGIRLSALETSVHWLKEGMAELKHDIDGLRERVTELRPDIDGFREKVAELKFSVDGLRGQALHRASPLALTAKGGEWLRESGMKAHIDAHRKELFAACASLKATNAYDAQEGIFRLFDRMILPAEFEERLKRYAYQEGTGIDFLRRIGAVYFRDWYLKEAGISLLGR